MSEAVIVTDLLRAQARARTAEIAVVVDGVGSLTFGAWEAAASQIAGAILDRGLAPGERVALAFTNDDALTFLVLYFAVLKAGGVVVPLDPRLTLDETVRVLDHCEARGLVLSDGLAERWKGLESVVTHLTWHVTWRQLAHMTGASGIFVQVRREPEDLADIVHPAGKTGPPRGVASTHEQLVSLEPTDPARDGSTLLHALPLHAYSGLHRVQLRALRDGMRVVVQPTFEARRFRELLEEHRITTAVATPSMLRGLVAAGGAGAPSSLRELEYATAFVSPATVADLATLLPGVRLVGRYAIAEGGGATCELAPEEASRRPGSAGKPVAPTEMRVVSAEGVPVGPDVVGHVELRHPSPRHYFKSEVATRATWRDDGWVATGDLGRIDADGFLTLVERADG